MLIRIQDKIDMKLFLNNTLQMSAWLLLGLMSLGVMKVSDVFAQTDGAIISPAAKGAYIRGLSVAEQENWELAIKYFGEAREEAPAWPDAFYNLAYSCRQAGGRELIAIAWYHAYLAAASGTADTDQVRAWIVEFEVRVESRVRMLIRGVKDVYSSMGQSSPPGLEALELARALAYLGDFSEAKEMASGILEGRRSEYYMAMAYMRIAREQGRAGDLAGARETFAEARKVAVQFPDEDGAYYEGEILYIPVSKERFYRDLSRSQADAGDIAGAKETTSWILDDEKNGAYFYIAVAQAKSGDISGAMETADQVPNNTMLSRSYTYGCIAREQARVGDVAGALESFIQARVIAARIDDEKEQSRQYSSIVTLQASVGDIVGARETAALIRDSEYSLMNTDRDISITAELSAKVHGKIATWERLADNLNRYHSVNNFNGFVELLEDKKLDEVAESLSAAADDIGLGLVRIRENEAVWQIYKEPVPFVEMLSVLDKTSSITLRSSYRDISKSEVQSMSNIYVREKSYAGFDGHSTINHRYDPKSINEDKVVMDYTTGLMWHHSGSETIMNWDKAKDWIMNLNSSGYAGYQDWRLPTVEEAVSLLESSKSNELFIDSVFSDMQEYFWTGDECDPDDECGSGYAWCVLFHVGSVGWNRTSDSYLPVRPVRSMD